VTEVCERMRVPTHTKQLALAVCKEHLKCHQALTLKPGTLWRLLQRLDVLRRPERVEAFIQACECDSRGRLGLEDREYPQAQYVLDAMQHEPKKSLRLEKIWQLKLLLGKNSQIARKKDKQPDAQYLPRQYK